MSTVAYPHIELDASGVAMLAGSRTKVIEIALDYLAHHWDADEIRRQHPYLSLGQIHSALAFYFDHRDELDGQIERQIESVEVLRKQAAPSLVTAKLQRLRQLP